MNNPLSHLLRGLANEFASAIAVVVFFVCCFILIGAVIYAAPTTKDCREGHVMIQGYCVTGYRPGKTNLGPTE